jgi:hypothetical protein
VGDLKPKKIRREMKKYSFYSDVTCFLLIETLTSSRSRKKRDGKTDLVCIYVQKVTCALDTTPLIFVVVGFFDHSFDSKY